MRLYDVTDGGGYFPTDLAKTANDLPTNQDYFVVPVTNLKIDSTYSFQFQWVYADDSVSLWSPGYVLNTSTENVPGAPSVSVPATSVSSIPVTLSSFPTNAKRVDIYVIGGEFGIGKVADYFLAAGTKNIAVAGGVYQVSLITVTPSGINGDPTNTFTITVSTVGETVEAPTNPNGFSTSRVLGGLEVIWAGTYANSTFTGFEAIKIYVGNSATATAGTYIEAGVMTGNNVRNSIIIPVDGTYLRYDQPAYIHAAAVNKNGTVGTLQQNVASNLLGARSAISSDLADDIITNAKLVADSVTATKIATGAITETKIATDAITSNKIVAGAITSAKIDALAITAEKIAADAITATKIKAGEIDVTKLSAGTISVNNLEAGTISSTSFIRAGTAGSARVELSSSNISGGPSAGFYIYNSAGAAVLSAPLTGGLTINGSGTFSGDISGASGTFTGPLTIGSNFSVTSTGVLSAASGTIGGWTINSTQLRSSGTNYISLNPSTPKIALVQGSTEKITIDPVEGIKDSLGNFILTPSGTLTVKGAITSGSTITGADITMTGAAGQTGIATTKLFFQSSNYAISAGASSYTYQGDSGYYDSEGDWVDTSAPQTISNNDIRFTDATYGGAIPYSSTYYYGELWLGSGNNSAGSVDLWANHPSGYIGISLVADSSSKNIYVYGDSTAGFTTQHRSSTSDSSKESPAFLQVDSAGRMSRGRAVITGGSSNPSSVLGLTGDLYFSTAT